MEELGRRAVGQEAPEVEALTEHDVVVTRADVARATRGPTAEREGVHGGPRPGEREDVVGQPARVVTLRDDHLDTRAAGGELRRQMSGMTLDASDRMRKEPVGDDPDSHESACNRSASVRSSVHAGDHPV